MPPQRAHTVLGFAIIGPAGDRSRQAAAREVGETLGCILRPRHERGLDVFAAEMLGMTVELLPWHGDGDETVLQLRAYSSWASSEDSVVLDISGAVIELMAFAGQGDWRVPSLADVDERRGGA